MRQLANDSSIIIKKCDKGFCVVVWDRVDYIAEAGKQLGVEMFIMILILKKKNLQKVAETSNNLFRNLKKMVVSQRKNLNILVLSLKMSPTCYLIPKIQKRLFDVPGRPVISNCGYPLQVVVPPPRPAPELWYPLMCLN